MSLKFEIACARYSGDHKQPPVKGLVIQRPGLEHLGVAVFTEDSFDEPALSGEQLPLSSRLRLYPTEDVLRLISKVRQKHQQTSIFA